MSTLQEAMSAWGSLGCAEIERFASLIVAVDDDESCWLWTDRTDDCGYGMFHALGFNWRAHRFAYMLLVGPIPARLQLDHLCRTVRCVRPTHLEPVAQKVNILRGEGWGAINARKTHCPANHPYDARNTYVDTSGRRRCRACRNARRRKGACHAGA